MKDFRKNQNLSHYGFTLIEMVIVLIIMWILLMLTVWLSGQQIQKVKDKAVKESILAEMQSRYSRNLWSSSIRWEMYENMEITLEKWSNKINFKYNLKNSENSENNFLDEFSDKFEIKYIALDDTEKDDTTTLTYTPYKISCKIWESSNKLSLVIRMNDHEDYCFEIDSKNCRLTEVTWVSCTTLKWKMDKD